MNVSSTDFDFVLSLPCLITTEKVPWSVFGFTISHLMLLTEPLSRAPVAPSGPVLFMIIPWPRVSNSKIFPGCWILLAVKVRIKSVPEIGDEPKDWEVKVIVSPISYPEPVEVTVTVLSDCELFNTTVNTAPVPLPLELPETPVTVDGPVSPVISNELVVNVPSPATNPSLPDTLEEEAAVNEPEATLVTNNEVPPFWK